MSTEAERSLDQAAISNEDSALALRQTQWRWLPFRSAQPSTQRWSTSECFAGVKDLLRSSARRSSGRTSLEREKAPRAILPPPCEGDSDDREKPTADPAVINIDASGEASAGGVSEVEACEVSDDVAGESSASPLVESVAEQPQRPEPEVEHTPCVESVVEDLGAPVILDVGFAQVELKKAQTWPKYEFYILGKDGSLTADGAVALIEFLDFVLNLPDVICTGFVLTYDVRSCTCPQLDLVSWIMDYIDEPDREEAWQERCVCWKVLVPPGMYFKMAESVLSLLFTVCPPKCRVFLQTDVDARKAENLSCYKPEDISMTRPGLLSTLSSGLLDTFFFSQDARRKNRQAASPTYSYTKAPSIAETSVSQETSLQEVEGAKLKTCAESLTTTFAVISQGFCQETDTGYLKITGLQAAMSDDGLGQIMNFMDDFVNSANAQRGFSITYDLRNLSMPSMNMVMQVAEWGNEPERQSKWSRLNTSCKVVVTSGMRFSICKGVLKSFFYMCPPVCRTFLLTNPDEPEENAIVFEPSGASSRHVEEDAQSDPSEAASHDGVGSRDHCADTLETTSTSARSSGSSPTETEEEERSDEWRLGEKADDCKQEDDRPRTTVSKDYVFSMHHDSDIDPRTWIYNPSPLV